MNKLYRVVMEIKSGAGGELYEKIIVAKSAEEAFRRGL